VSPSVALVVWLIFLWFLLRLSKDRTQSAALWLPVIWLLIISFRLPSQWLGLNPGSVVQAFEEGSALDRTVYLSLSVIALGVLGRRSLQWGEIVSRNLPLILFLLFALASVTWSDFPYQSFKRWFRDFGMYLMILVVITDRSPAMAISTVVRRFTCILALMSLMLIKYYTAIAVLYNPWSGAPEYVGATTSKNMLGVVCLLSGLFYFWDTLNRWVERKSRRGKLVLFSNLVMIWVTFRLLMLSQSATSLGCLIMGCLTIALLRSRWTMAKPGLVATLIPLLIGAAAVIEFVFDIPSVVAQLLGRDPTLTGRTGIWATLLQMQTNPLLGVGYQSFWMGDRLVEVWTRLNTGFLNEAHNGYLEIFLNLGIVGVFLIIMFMIAGYRTICRQLVSYPHIASLGITLWLCTVIYNFTESAYGASPLWFILVMFVAAGPILQEAFVNGNNAPPDRGERGTVPGQPA
jgi:exopolysaccharide production protein ExoQ